MTRTGDREIRSVSGRLPDNPGELARMQRCKELMDYLVNRGYDLNFLKTQIRRASDISRNDALKPKPKQQTDTVPIIPLYLTYPV